MKEIWKWIPGYENQYKVSSLGRVKSVERVLQLRHQPRTVKERLLCVWKNHRGYPMVSLSKGAIKYSYPIHRLVAIAFIENVDNKPEVNHINGIKDDNKVENLEWCTRLENTHHFINELGKHHAGEAHYKARLKVDDVLMMRKLYKTGKYSMAAIGRMYGVGKDHAANVIKEKVWKTLKRA